ncbi:hypothetical protein CcI49_11430 [Frankia sp. CcI49]|uniref:ABC transporter substrate-binding protein n=1 Tax=Frankia sp. CcI49 TaxID=1745382 RepID=UPI0009763B90|nr:ABC transporter substrate-binding protein [Frankia sp. CcI49]ONH60438.1 hypothetical protein CcI49_11430 [Frankia sp. CcI49]
MKSLNASGGLGGHPVKLIVKDVGSSTTGGGITAAKELINQDHVLAIIDHDLQDSKWVKIAEAAKVPVIAGTPGQGALISPNTFPVIPSTIALGYGTFGSAKQLGSTFGFVYASELAATFSIDTYKAFAKAAGVSMPVALAVSATSPEYTAVCQQLIDADVDSYEVGGASAMIEKIARQCHQQGLKAPQVLLGASFIKSWLTDPAFNNSIVEDIGPGAYDSDLPGQKAYRAALEQYEKDFVGQVTDNAFAQSGWTAGKMIEVGVGKITGDLTPVKLQSALYTIKGETLGGLVQPTTYTAGQITTNSCWFNWKILDGKSVPVNDSKPLCAPAEVIKPVIERVAKALGG